MKLPKSDEKFVVIAKNRPLLAGSVVSGVHVEIWADNDNPDVVFYHMCINRVYDSDYVSRYGNSVYCLDTLNGLMERFNQYFAPYQEPEPETQPAIPGGSSGKGGADGQ
ncbi:MAG: hypothetical protein K2H45_15645 [Acetatifactor sp.]|nr:hypothetical protein [Acetatifactor sp.]